MTRIIVRNLPDKITKEKLYDIFSEKGTVTDIQLKYTKTGVFRKFAFIGYQKQEQADAAVDTLNRTFINTSRIQIEPCKGLADPEKPRSWSKHAPDSSVNQRKRAAVEEDEDAEEVLKKKEKESKRKIKDPKLEELVSKYKDDDLFKEFVEAQMPAHEILEEINKSNNEQNDVEQEVKIADRSITDLEYLKLKTGRSELSIGKDDEKVEVEGKKKKEPKNLKLYTIKVKGLPVKFKKSEIKAFLDAKPFTIRRACGNRDIIFVGFKSESAMKKALFKNRSFFSGKRIYVREVKTAEETESKSNVKWEKQEEKLKNEESVAESGRIFVRNLPYVISEDDIRELFEKYGPIADVVLPIDSFTRKPKGFCVITFVMPEHASRAFTELDGTIFQGRMLHLLPGTDANKKNEEIDEAVTNYKLKKLLKDKKNAGCNRNWNTLFVSESALASAMAETYNTTKENVLNDGKNVAVRLALGETQVINKMKEFLEENGVSLESLNDISNCKRSKNVILVKNLPFGTKLDDLRQKFSAFGELQRVVLPPNGITGIVEFIEPSEAKKAFMKLAYSKFQNLPMYLEWAPEKIFKEGAVVKENKGEEKQFEKENQSKDSSTVDADYIPLENTSIEGATIFVKNLNFTTGEDSLRQHFSKCGRVLSVTVAQKKDPKQPGKKLSLGYGFIQFSSKEEADNALKTLQFSKLDDHRLELKRSSRVTKPEQNFRNFAGNSNKPSSKILVKNVPFQATEKEVSDLFKVFGEIKAVRLPKKMVGTGSHRGFCFVEYHTIHDAKRAFKVLSQSTHLYGRRLVLEWASTDDEDVDVIRTKTAERFKPGVKKKAISTEMETTAADSD